MGRLQSPFEKAAWELSQIIRLEKEDQYAHLLVFAVKLVRKLDKVPSVLEEHEKPLPELLLDSMILAAIEEYREVTEDEDKIKSVLLRSEMDFLSDIGKDGDMDVKKKLDEKFPAIDQLNLDTSNN